MHIVLSLLVERLRSGKPVRLFPSFSAFVFLCAPALQIWVPHFCILTKENRLSFMEDPNGYMNEEDGDLIDYKKVSW